MMLLKTKDLQATTFKLLLVVFATFAICTSTIHSQWKQVKGFSVGTFQTICGVGGNKGIEYGLIGGQFYSFSYFTGWVHLEPTPFVDGISLTCEGNMVYAGTDGFGIFRSSDYGKTWVSLKSALPSRFSTTLVVSNHILVAGTADDWIWYSLDSGKMWSRSSNPRGNTSTQDIFAVGNNLYAASGVDAFVSHDNGITWSQIPLSWFSKNLTITEASNALLIGTSNSGLYRSFDQGANWQHLIAQMPDSTIFTSVSLHDTIYIGTLHGLFVSTNQGTSWAPVKIDFQSHPVFWLESHNGAFFAVVPNGVFVSYDNGKSWASPTKGLAKPSSFIGAMVASGNLLVAAPEEREPRTERGVYYSTDHGETWAKGSGIESGFVKVLLAKGSLIFAGTDSGGVYISSDQGATWLQRSDGLPKYLVTSQGEFRADHRNITALGLIGGNLYAGTGAPENDIYETDSLLFVSSDFGDSWHRLSLPPLEYFLHHMTTAILTSEQNIIARDDGNHWLISSDHGVSWRVGKENKSGNNDPLPIEMIGNQLYAFTDTIIGQRFIIGIVESSDFGTHWTSVWKTAQDTLPRTIVSYGSNLIVGTYLPRVFVSSDSAKTWNEYSDGLPSSIYYPYNKGFTFAGGYAYVNLDQYGISARPLAEMGIPDLDLAEFASLQGSQTQLNFGTHLIGTDSSIEVTVNNRSAQDVVIEAATISGPERSDFSVRNSKNVTFPLVSLPSGDSLVFTVTFAANSPGHVSNAILIVRYNQDSLISMGIHGISKANGNTSVLRSFSDPAVCVYPNPTDGLMYVLTGADPVRAIEVFDALGRRQLSWNQESLDNGQYDVATLPTGVYFLRISTTDGIRTQTLVRR